MTTQVDLEAWEAEQAAWRARRDQLIEELQHVIDTGAFEPTQEIIGKLVELEGNYYPINVVEDLIEQWSLEGKKRYAAAFGYDINLQWEDKDFLEFRAKAWNKSTTVGKIGFNCFGDNGLSDASIDAWCDLPEEQQRRLHRLKWENNFAKQYINELIERFDQAKYGEAIVVRKGRYPMFGDWTPPLKISNTPKNRAEIARLKSFIEEEQHREDLVDIGLLGDTTNDTTHLR